MALLTLHDGVIARTPQEAGQLEAAGFLRCYGKLRNRVRQEGDPTTFPCDFCISPQAVESVRDTMGGYYTCPRCQQSFDIMEDMPWHGVPEDESSGYGTPGGFQAGGGTRIGLPMKDQAQIGEDLVHGLGQIPGYGQIVWWHEGGAIAQSPLDGATKDWGIEVKTLGYDATHHRFIPGRTSERNGKNSAAAKMGLKGILGILVLLDYRRSIANIYAREMPLQPWTTNQGRLMPGGVASFRSGDPSTQHLVAEVPFQNPLTNPHDPSPVSASSFAGGSAFEHSTEGEPMPF
jgi:hypothetical protein